MSDKKPCALEGPEPGAPQHRDSAGTDASNHNPCALLCPDPPPRPSPQRGAEEDESADPVGDGHSDADWAARHGRHGGGGQA